MPIYNQPNGALIMYNCKGGGGRKAKNPEDYKDGTPTKEALERVARDIAELKRQLKEKEHWRLMV